MRPRPGGARKTCKPNVSINKPSRAPVIVVRGRSASASTGILFFGALRVRCTLGRSGRRRIKREGDGATPAGVWRLQGLMYRQDRMPRPRSGLALRSIRADDGWCDATGNRNYNRKVRHPYPASAEHLWRRDHLYDLIIVLGYNDRPRIQGRGSAIFIDLARTDFNPTEGCIALRPADLRRLLPHLRRSTRVRIV